MGQKPDFEAFLAAVDGGDRDFVQELHGALTEGGCKLELKEAKSGFVASYVHNKKTILNYVFRKKGLIARIYANHIQRYMELLDALPGDMVRAVRDAPPCKRLLNPEACNPKCAMGYDFLLGGERLQLCRYSAFQFLVSPEHNPHIRALVLRELEESAAGD